MYLLGISVLEEEVGFMFGQYKRLRNEFTGILTGKDFLWGSLIDQKLRKRILRSKHAGN
jgi:glutamate dehydrogenase/leucine dehydrogenase